MYRATFPLYNSGLKGDMPDKLSPAKWQLVTTRQGLLWCTDDGIYWELSAMILLFHCLDLHILLFQTKGHFYFDLFSSVSKKPCACTVSERSTKFISLFALKGNILQLPVISSFLYKLYEVNQ